MHSPPSPLTVIEEYWLNSKLATKHPKWSNSTKPDNPMVRGQRVLAEQLDDAKIYAETAQLDGSEFGTAFLPVASLVMGSAGRAAHRHPKLTRHALRLANVLSLLIGLLAIPFLLGERLPAARDAAVIAIAAFGTISVSLAYDRMLGGVAGSLARWAP